MGATRGPICSVPDKLADGDLGGALPGLLARGRLGVEVRARELCQLLVALFDRVLEGFG